MVNLEDAVKRGAQAFDRLFPGSVDQAPWWEKVDPDALWMSNGYNCVIGQLYGQPYYTVRQRVAQLLEPDVDPDSYTNATAEDTLVRYGFTRELGSGFLTWDHLTSLWRTEINQRRAMVDA